MRNNEGITKAKFCFSVRLIIYLHYYSFNCGLSNGSRTKIIKERCNKEKQFQAGGDSHMLIDFWRNI